MPTRFNLEPTIMAKRLLGQRLVRIVDDVRLSGIIVEVEAYLGERDKAAHTYAGRRTPRNEAMYKEGGHAYVYFTYGMHHCMNVVCGKVDEGVAVLIRALEPEEGINAMFARRAAAVRETDLCSGPARLCEALSIDRSLNGVDLRRSAELRIEQVRQRALPNRHIARTARIGVAYAGEWADAPLRFVVRNNPHVSRPV